MSKLDNRRGTALLAVLWLTTALSMIAFSVASSVRSEIERSIGQQESLRAYYLARGAVEQTIFRLRESPASGLPLDQYLRASRRGYVRFASGEALVEIVSEQAKLHPRQLTPALLESLLAVMGEPIENRVQVTNGLLALGRGFPGQLLNPVGFAGQNPAAGSTFLPSLASLDNVEELMLLPGINSEVMYGRFQRQADGALRPVAGLLDCISPLTQPGSPLDVYNVHPTLLIAMGMDPAKANALAEARAVPGADRSGALAPFLGRDPSGAVLAIGDVGPGFQIRATARVRTSSATLSETRRTVSLLVHVVPPPPQYFWLEAFNYLRWYDQAHSELAARTAPWLPVMTAADVQAASQPATQPGAPPQ
jgi:hypothetical protein